MSRPTIAYCLALIEKQNILIDSLEERLKKVENAQFQRRHAKPAARSSGFVSLAKYAADACKFHGSKTVTRQQIEEYVATLSK